MSNRISFGCCTSFESVTRRAARAERRRRRSRARMESRWLRSSCIPPYPLTGYKRLCSLVSEMAYLLPTSQADEGERTPAEKREGKGRGG